MEQPLVSAWDWGNPGTNPPVVSAKALNASRIRSSCTETLGESHGHRSGGRSGDGGEGRRSRKALGIGGYLDRGVSNDRSRKVV